MNIVRMMYPTEVLAASPMFLPGVLILRIRVKKDASMQSRKLEMHQDRAY